MRNDPSRSSKVIDFGTNRKHVCDFLVVINSNLGPSSPRFRDIAGILRRATTPLFHPNFRVFPLHLIADFVAWRSEHPKLIIHAINFELVQYICTRYVQRDRQTNGRRTIATLRASRCKKIVEDDFFVTI